MYPSFKLRHPNRRLPLTESFTELTIGRLNNVIIILQYYTIYRYKITTPILAFAYFFRHFWHFDIKSALLGLNSTRFLCNTNSFLLASSTENNCRTEFQKKRPRYPELSHTGPRAINFVFISLSACSASQPTCCGTPTVWHRYTWRTRDKTHFCQKIRPAP